jgi:hypothetical protein
VELLSPLPTGVNSKGEAHLSILHTIFPFDIENLPMRIIEGEYGKVPIFN